MISSDESETRFFPNRILETCLQYSNALLAFFCDSRKSLIMSAKIFSYSCESVRESINSYYADAFPSHRSLNNIKSVTCS